MSALLPEVGGTQVNSHIEQKNMLENNPEAVVIIQISMISFNEPHIE